MPTLNIAAFQKILSSSTGYGIVSLENEELSVSSADREYKLTELTADAKARNIAVRTALLDALSADSGAGAPYLDFLKKKILGDDAKKTLDTTQLRSILNRHITVKTLAGSAGKSTPSSSGAALAKAAGEHAISLTNLTINNPKAFFASLDKNARNPKTEAKDLISSTFAQILKSADKELGNAYKLRGAKVGSKDGLEVLKNAANALSDLAEFARSVGNRLTRNGKEWPAELNRLIDFASARQSELHVIAGSIEGIVEFEKTVGTAPNVKQMMATLAGKMHSAEDVTSQIDDKLKALNDRMKTWTDHPNEKSTESEINEIKEELLKADAFAEEVTSSGLFGSMQVENSFLDGLKKHLSEAKETLAEVASLSRKTGMLKMLDEAYGEKNIQPRKNKKVRNRWYRLGEFVRTTFTDRITSGEPIDPGFISSTWSELRTMKNEIGFADDLPKAFFRDEFLIFANKMSALQSDRRQEGDGILTASHSDVKMLLQGKIALGTLLGARMYGFSDKMINPELDDKNLVSSSQRGSGQVSTVTTVKHKVSDGKGGTRIVTHVFKPETTALIAVGLMRSGDANFSGAKNWIAQINRSSHAVAKLIGAGDVIPKVTVGMFRGQFGFFMEEAKGTSGANYCNGATADGEMLEKPFPKRTSLNETQLNTLTGSLMKGTNELMWTDWLTGQLDRHGDNYLVSIDETTFKATVKGIDNDLSFSSERVGLRKFRLNKERLKTFLPLGTNGQPMTVDEFNTLFPNNRLTPVPGKPDIYEIDAGDNESLISLLGQTFGMNSFARPKVIGKTMYDTIMNFEKAKNLPPGDHPLIQAMGHGYTDEQRSAALSRLNEMIDYLSHFDRSQIIPDDKWNDKNTQTAIRNTFRSKKTRICSDCPKNAPKDLKEKIKKGVSDYVNFAAEDYFVREFGKLLPS